LELRNYLIWQHVDHGQRIPRPLEVKDLCRHFDGEVREDLVYVEVSLTSGREMELLGASTKMFFGYGSIATFDGNGCGSR
jgi:hypothetical protein